MILDGGFEGVLMDSCVFAAGRRIGLGGGAMTSGFMECGSAVLRTRDYEVGRVGRIGSQRVVGVLWLDVF